MTWDNTQRADLTSPGGICGLRCEIGTSVPRSSTVATTELVCSAVSWYCSSSWDKRSWSVRSKPPLWPPDALASLVSVPTQLSSVLATCLIKPARHSPLAEGEALAFSSSSPCTARRRAARCSPRKASRQSRSFSTARTRVGMHSSSLTRKGRERWEKAATAIRTGGSASGRHTTKAHRCVNRHRSAIVTRRVFSAGGASTSD